MIKLNFRRGAAFANKKANEYLKDKNPEDFKSIAVIRHAAIGDFVVMRPFLIELKKFFPNANITLSVISSYMYGIPEDLIDNVHVIDKQHLDNKQKKTSFFYRYHQIKQLPPQDIIFDLTDSALTLLIMLFSKTKLKIGFPYRPLKRFFYDITTVRSDFVFEAQSIMHQINILGANTKHYPLDYGITKKKRELKNPYVVYFAGASMKSKCWNEENFIELIKKMIVSYPNYTHIILKGIQDDEQFNEIYNPFKNTVNVIHQNPLPLEEIYDYLAQSTLLVSGDTGVRNMAIGSNTATVGIMLAAKTSPIRYLPKTEKHQAVFNVDGTQPSVNEVYKTVREIITLLDPKDS
jgi:ADP-heptose:LPS heptosyltransferase